MDGNSIQEISNLTDEELLQLYQMISDHLTYLQDSILDPSIGGEEDE